MQEAQVRLLPERESAPRWGGPSGLGWLSWERSRGVGWEEGPALRGPQAQSGEGVSTSLEDIAMKVMWGPGVLQTEFEGFLKGDLFLVPK